MASAYTNGESEDGEFLAVYLVRGSVLSLSFVEPKKRDRPKKPDEPAPRHMPGNGLQTKTPDPFVFRHILHFYLERMLINYGTI
jgi:hypothetical protein